MIVFDYKPDDVSEQLLTEKYRNLCKLSRDGYRVPEGIYLGPDEFDYFVQHSRVSDLLGCAVDRFVNLIKQKAFLPLFSIRAEGKKIGKPFRIPTTMLNVGIRLFAQGSMLPLGCNHIIETARISYADRMQAYDAHRDIPLGDLREELLSHIRLMYLEMAQRKTNYTKGVIIQRMVFGNYDRSSGMGICCNWPGPQTQETCCKGVFLPGHQGIPRIKGSWGYYEVDFSKLKEINQPAYAYIKELYWFLSRSRFQNPYIEFTVEGDNVFVLQAEDRQRYVRSTMQETD